MAHSDTIGRIKYGGKTYEIDWPEDPGNPSVRNTKFGFIYLDGEIVGDCVPENFGSFSAELEVMQAAGAVIKAGETDDQD